MKATREEYKESPFFYRELNGKQYRYVAWDSDEETQRVLFYELISQMGDRIEYLFKEDFDNGNKETQWVRISGGIYKNTLITLINKFDKWFFSDSVFQLCCREPDVEGYFAYDEHGIFYIYDKEVKDTLLKLGFSFSPKKELLSEKPHWHVRPKDAEATLARFKQEIKNESVFCNDEADKDELRREVKPKEQ